MPAGDGACSSVLGKDWPGLVGDGAKAGTGTTRKPGQAWSFAARNPSQSRLSLPAACRPFRAQLLGCVVPTGSRPWLLICRPLRGLADNGRSVVRWFSGLLVSSRSAREAGKSGVNWENVQGGGSRTVGGRALAVTSLRPVARVAAYDRQRRSSPSARPSPSPNGGHSALRIPHSAIANPSAERSGSLETPAAPWDNAWLTEGTYRPGQAGRISATRLRICR